MRGAGRGSAARPSRIGVDNLVITGLFVLVWAVALVYWRVGKVEDRWSAAVPATAALPATTDKP